jgi:hypothetical protein
MFGSYSFGSIEFAGEIGAAITKARTKGVVSMRSNQQTDPKTLNNIDNKIMFSRQQSSPRTMDDDRII